MRGFARIYSLYQTRIFKLIRTSLFLILFTWFISQVAKDLVTPEFKASLFFFSIFLMSEIFFRFKVKKVLPKISVSQNSRSPLDSFTLAAVSLLLNPSFAKATEGFLKNLLKLKEVEFILAKSDIKKEEIQIIEVGSSDLQNSAFNLVKNIHGKYVTAADLFAAYILITEEKTKLLFSKKLKEEDFVHILQWARFDFPFEENPAKTKINFWGGGIGEEWVSGWTLETKKYTADLTSKAVMQKPLLMGRAKEYENFIKGLLKKEKNNVLLVGETGSGKTSMVESFVFESFLGKLPQDLNNRRVLEFLTGDFLAGITNQGDLETRLQAIIKEIAHSDRVILFIPEFQNILGDPVFHVDLSGALLPYLKDGSLPIIASMTSGNYKMFVEGKTNLLDVFEVINFNEADVNLATQMLLEKAKDIEKKYFVSLTYKSVAASVALAARFARDRILPGSAVVLISDAANSVSLSGRKKVTEDDIVKRVEEKTKIAVGVPSSEEKNLLLNFEARMHERVIGQEEAVHFIGEALRRIRSGLSTQNKPISFLFLGPTGVGKTETAKALSDLYFGGESKMIRLDMSEYTTEDGVKRLLGAPPGEGQERGELTEKVYDNPFSLVLLDEFEKANTNIHNLFLQVLDDGRLTDNKGKTISFADTIIIATSNAASEFIREELSKGTAVDKNFQQKLLDLLQTKGLFKPELLNRFDAIVVFKPLAAKEVEEITKLLLKSLTRKLLEQDISVIFDNKIIAKIVREGPSIEFGARPLKRFIQDNIDALMSQKILRDEIKRGDKIVLSTNESGAIIVYPQEEVSSVPIPPAQQDLTTNLI